MRAEKERGQELDKETDVYKEGKECRVPRNEEKEHWRRARENDRTRKKGGTAGTIEMAAIRCQERAYAGEKAPEEEERVG